MKSGKLETIGLVLTAVGSVILTGVWIVSLAWIIVAAMGQLMTPPAFAQTRRPAVELERAITLEQVDGDLNAAITAYQKIAGNTSAPKDVRAKALLQLAGCYEKLGRQAGDVYQQIVRDFGDQPAAEQARTRLAVLKKEASVNASVKMRRADFPGRQIRFGTTDGEHTIFRDESTGEIFYSDHPGKVQRVIYKTDVADVRGIWPSRDLSLVVLYFANKPDRPAFLALIKSDGTGYRELVRNDEAGRSQGLGFDDIRLINWSWDNRELLVTVNDTGRLTGPGGGRLLVIAASDGKRRQLLDVKVAFLVFGRFSPDGRFVAYETFQPSSGGMMRTFVMPAAGGKSILIHEEPGGVAAYPCLLDWTPDGRYLAITSSGSGTPAPHLFPMKDGQSAGPAIPVQPGRFIYGEMTPSGAMLAS